MLVVVAQNLVEAPAAGFKVTGREVPRNTHSERCEPDYVSGPDDQLG